MHFSEATHQLVIFFVVIWSICYADAVQIPCRKWVFMTHKNLLYKTINSLANWDWGRHSDTLSACLFVAKFLDPSCNSICTGLTSQGCQISIWGVWPDQTAPGKTGTETKWNFFPLITVVSERQHSSVIKFSTIWTQSLLRREKKRRENHIHIFIGGENILLSLNTTSRSTNKWMQPYECLHYSQ